MSIYATQEEIERVVETYSDMLLRLAASRVHSLADAEDVVQETFLRLLTCRSGFQSAEHEKAWLIRTTLHRASDHLRRAEAHALPLDEALTVSTDEEPESDLLAAVRALPAEYGAVIHLYYYEGYSIQEIARLLRLPRATVGTRLARGRKRLATLLKEENI